MRELSRFEFKQGDLREQLGNQPLAEGWDALNRSTEFRF